MKKKVTFESQLMDLEQLVKKMDQSDLPLEEAIACYQKGITLSHSLNEMLDDAEQKVEFLSKKGKSEPKYEGSHN